MASPPGSGRTAHPRRLLDGGFLAWREAKLPVVPVDKLPPRDAKGRTVWVTRERPKIDRIACPWLIRRFVDPRPVFLFVAGRGRRRVRAIFGARRSTSRVSSGRTAARLCTFDVMVEEFGLGTEALQRLAASCAAPTRRGSDLAPEAPGLLAVSLGLSRMESDDLRQLEAGLTIYDALYRWCRDATGETHNWPNRRAGA